jgi:serine/threonine protein kinase
MGVVFRADDPHLGRTVALKVMLPAVAADGTARQRFLREAQAVAAIKHDHIVSVYAVGEDRGIPYLAMELLEGELLETKLQHDGKLPVSEVVLIGHQISLGLAAAHERGLIHRDIKPSNVWLESCEAASGGVANGENPAGHHSPVRVKILDFGLARIVGADAQITQQGAILGTPAYMAPEQADGKTLDPRCDLFSLGCILYRMTTGELPFRGIDVMSMLLAVATENPRPPREIDPLVPGSLSRLIIRMLAKKPHGRPPSALAVARALEQVGAGGGRPSKKWLAASATTVVGLILIALWAGGMIDLRTPDAVVEASKSKSDPPQPNADSGKQPSIPPIEPKKPDAPLPPDRPGWIGERWIRVVSGLPAEKQVTAVRTALQERNTDFDGTIKHRSADGVVTEFELNTETVHDLSPLIALTGLQRLDCSSAQPWQSSLADLSPLTRLPLRSLRYPYHTHLGAEPLRSIKTLTTVNDQPVAEFWKTVDAEIEDAASFAKRVAGLSPKDQPKAVADRLKERNPGFDGDVVGRIDNGAVVDLNVNMTGVADISPVLSLNELRNLTLQPKKGLALLKDLTPLRALKLTRLSLHSCSQVRDLAPLKDLPLTQLNLGECGKIRELTHLKNMPLTWLYLRYLSEVDDLSPLSGLPLTYLDITVCGQLRDLSPLEGLKLNHLNFGNCSQISDLTPLKGMPLTYLGAERIQAVRDISPIRGMPLRHLRIHDTRIEDLTPLEGMQLEVIVLTPRNITKGLDILRGMTSLKNIYADKVYTPDEFWARYDAGGFKK